MTYADKKNNQASRKFGLVRIEPAKFINGDLTVQSNGTTYDAVLPGLIISKIEENGSPLTKITSGNPASGQYSFVESGGTLVIAPTSIANALVAFHYLFYTTERTKSTYEDPQDESTTIREWEPKITNIPSISQSIENLDNGFFSIRASGLSIVNDSFDFNSYLGPHHSFYNKEVMVWNALDSTETSNVQKSFIGKIKGLTLSPTSVNFKIDDNFSRLKEPAAMGDGRKYNYWTVQDYPNIYKEHNNTPIPFYFGSVSRFKTVFDSVGGLSSSVNMDPESLAQAVCTEFETPLTQEINRQWGIGRVPSTGLNEFVHSIITSNHQKSDNTQFTIASHTRIYPGDTGFVTIGGASTNYFRVHHVDRPNNLVFTTKTNSGNWDKMHLGPVQVCISQQTDVGELNFYPLWGRDYDINHEATDGGNSYISITLQTLFEALHTNMQTMDPTSDKVLYRIKPKQDEQTHGKVLKYILQKIGGFTFNESTFTAADTDLVTNVNFSMPNYNEGDFSSYFKYIGELCKSTLGYLRLNNSFDLEYHVHNSLSSNGTSVGINDIAKDSINSEIDYEDVINGIVAFNGHFVAAELQTSASDSTTSAKAKYLHGIDRVFKYEHVLESISTRMADIFNMRKERTLKYNFKTQTVNLDSLIGQDLLLEYNTIDGSSTSAIRILSLDKSPDQTGVLASDFLGL